MNPIRWGILGCGSIAGGFAECLLALPDATLVAVGSRSQAKADEFGSKYNAPNRYGSYAALASDPEVDVIYIATPHPMHAEDSLLCLAAGKAVLSEKPFTVNEAQAAQVIHFARENRLFLMEGMWSRFLPLMGRLREMLKEGIIGEPRLLQADYGFRAEFDPESRLFDPALGGGALLDVGVYVVSLASMVFGTATQVSGVAHIGETGVDEQAALALGYSGGALAVLSTAVRTKTPHDLTISGTEGVIKVHSPWWEPQTLTISRNGQPDEVISEPTEGSGFKYEAAEVMRCLRAGKLESDIMPLDETRAIMRTMDTLREQWGLKYPME